MKKIASLLFIASTVFTTHAFASDYCKAREIFEARIAHAKEFSLDVEAVSFVRYMPGPWTEMTGSNSGQDKVMVAHWILDGEQQVPMTYTVSAHQMGRSSDCTITKVEKKLQ